LYKECALQADYSIPQAGKDDQEMPKTEAGEDLGVGEGWWLTGKFAIEQLMVKADGATETGLQPTFSTWSQVTMLHMYLIAARFRCFPTLSQTQTWQQDLLDHFFYDAENRMMVNHNMHARGTRNKYLKDLFIQWRGLLAAYDEGIYKGDAVLAAAIWRNVFKANENVDIKVLAQIVSYMRRALKGLDSMPDETLMSVDLQFGSPKDEANVVAMKSKMMDLPFEKAPGKDFPPTKKA
jgi:cytochrome b pre-mRNA-processing protein 3